MARRNQPLRHPDLVDPVGDPVISLDSVSVTYRSKGQNGLLALDKVSLNVADNEFVTLVGPSGCGKSTLLRLVAGRLIPTTGRVTVGGRAGTVPGGDIAMVVQ